MNTTILIIIAWSSLTSLAVQILSTVYTIRLHTRIDDPHPIKMGKPGIMIVRSSKIDRSR